MESKPIYLDARNGYELISLSAVVKIKKHNEENLAAVLLPGDSDFVVVNVDYDELIKELRILRRDKRKDTYQKI